MRGKTNQNKRDGRIQSKKYLLTDKVENQNASNNISCDRTISCN